MNHVLCTSLDDLFEYASHFAGRSTAVFIHNDAVQVELEYRTSEPRHVATCPLNYGFDFMFWTRFIGQQMDRFNLLSFLERSHDPAPWSSHSRSTASVGTSALTRLIAEIKALKWTTSWKEGRARVELEPPLPDGHELGHVGCQVAVIDGAPRRDGKLTVELRTGGAEVVFIPRFAFANAAPTRAGAVKDLEWLALFVIEAEPSEPIGRFGPTGGDLCEKHAKPALPQTFGAMSEEPALPQTFGALSEER